MTVGYLRRLRFFSRDIQLFLLAAVLVAFSWDGMRTVLFNLYLLRLGHGPELVGVFNAANALLFALSCLPAGALGARWSSRGLLIAGVGLLALGLCLLPLTGFLPAAWQVPWLLGIGLPTSLGLALYLVHGLPFMMGATQSGERSFVFSLHISLSPLAGFAGSLAGGLLPGLFATLLGVSLDDPVAFRYPLLLDGLILIPAVLILLRTETPGRQPRQAPTGEGTGRPPYGLLLLMALIMALRFGGRGTVQTFFNVYLDAGLGTPTAVIGALVAVAQLASVPAALSAPALVARRGAVPTIALGTLGIALGTLPLALIPHWGAAGAGYLASTIFFSTTIGPIRLFSQELVAPAWRTAMATAFMMGSGAAFSVVSLLGGYAITALGYNLLFLAGAGMTAMAALLFWAYFRVPRGELARVDAASEPALGAKAPLPGHPQD